MNKIIEGAKEALAFATGEGQAAKIHTPFGGEYCAEGYPLIQHKVNDGWIVWNWKFRCWDSVKEPVHVVR